MFKDAISTTVTIECIKMIPLVICSIMAIVLGFVAWKKALLQKKWAILLIIMGIIFVSYATYVFTCMGLDIKNESYVSYNGNFEVTIIPNSESVVHIPDEKSLCDHYYNLPKGYYYGEVVYTKRSKIVVYINAEPCG